MTANIVQLAESQLGVPYVYGGASHAGFDCSGLALWIVQQLGLDPNGTWQHGSTWQFYNSPAPRVDGPLEPGDFVFFDYEPAASQPEHVGIYIDTVNGQLRMINAPHEGTVVQYSFFQQTPGVYYGATRPASLLGPTVGEIITNVAEHWGIDPLLALADSWVESEINPKSIEYGVPISEAGLGLYQLTPGGELGNLTQAQAFDPATNANVALAEFAQVQAQTGLSGGDLAAAAQRPEFPGPYAIQVNHIMADIKSGALGQAYLDAINAPAGVPLPFSKKEVPLVFTFKDPNSGDQYLCNGSGKANCLHLTPAQMTQCTAAGFPHLLPDAALYAWLLRAA